MRITEITIAIAQHRPNDRIRGFAAMTIDDCFTVRNLRIIEMRDGRTSLMMPSRRIEGPAPDGHPTLTGKDGHPHHYRDIAHPIDRHTRQAIEDAVLERYCRCLESGEQNAIYHCDITTDRARVAV